MLIERDDVHTVLTKDLYKHFESLGNNCEFGIVQRQAGYDPPGLFRNVGFLDVEQMIRGLSAGLDKMFEPGHYDFFLPEGWPDWRLNCRVYGFGFHSSIPAQIKQGSGDWFERVPRVIKLFQYLKRKILEDLESAQKVFVFRSIESLSDDKVARLLSAVRMHGDAPLLVVKVDKSKATGTIEVGDGGVAIAVVDRLSNENPPVIDFGLWEAIARRVLVVATGDQRIPKQRNESGLNFPQYQPPLPFSIIIAHPAPETGKVPATIFTLDLEGLANVVFITVIAWVYLPSEFIGTDLNLVLHGYKSESFKKANPTKVGRWQRISVTARIPDGQTRAVPTLSVAASSPCVIYSAGWVIVHRSELS